MNLINFLLRYIKETNIIIGYDSPIVSSIVGVIEDVLRRRGFNVKSSIYNPETHFTILVVVVKPEIVSNGNFTVCITTIPEVKNITKKPTIVLSLREVALSINELMIGYKFFFKEDRDEKRTA